MTDSAWVQYPFEPGSVYHRNDTVNGGKPFGNEDNTRPSSKGIYFDNFSVLNVIENNAK